MPIALRGPDAFAVLKHKEAIKAALIESDTLAVLQAGGRTFTLPVYIQKNGGAAIESDFTFHDARANTNIVVDGEKATILRFEKIQQSEPEPPAPVQKTDTWTPPPFVVPGSQSTAQDEKWQPNFHKLSLTRTWRGRLFVDKFLDFHPTSREKIYQCTCGTCNRTVQATQSDLLLERPIAKSCTAH